MMIPNLSHTNLIAATLAVATLAVAQAASADLVNRWSFSETGGAGTVLVDSVGGQNATITDVGANNGDVGTSNAGQVTLTGGAKADSDFVSLPNNILNIHTDATIELWATNITVQNWSRLFSFGSTTSNNLFMSWTKGTDLNSDRVGFTIGSENRIDDSMSPYTLNTEYHVAMVIDDDGGAGGITQVSVYRDGAFRGSFDTTYDLNQLIETENTLGRAKFNDNVANALFNELRIYDGALSAAEVAASFAEGPNSIIPTPAALPAGLALIGLGAMRRGRRG